MTIIALEAVASSFLLTMQQFLVLLWFYINLSPSARQIQVGREVLTWVNQEYCVVVPVEVLKLDLRASGMLAGSSR